MIYMAISKDEAGNWVILKYLTSVINQRSPVTDETIGDVSRLDAAGRIAKGFWIQNDIFVNTGEFTELESKVTTFDDVNGIVINTYTYKLMDLDVIREEMKNRVRSYRSQLSIGTYTKDNNVFDVSSVGMTELQGYIIQSQLDTTLASVSIRLQSGSDVSFTVSELKSFYLELCAWREGLFDTEAQLVLAIDSAADYEAIRNVSVWGDVVL